MSPGRGRGGAPARHERRAFEVTLSWGECDPAGIVYYATYLGWAERLHSEWWLAQGLHLSEMHDRLGARFSVRRVEVDYLAPALPLERVRCAMAVAAVGRTSFTQRFTFTRPAEGDVFAVMDLVAVFATAERVPTPIPDLARSLLEGGPASDPVGS
ncbi:acyl-CoA thioesterase [Iamia majanohamensis]|uniref:Acyl-CoA thioesterase n=1 Tax=Iamia majanohamensis TaxID=467976 RepID=A0AAE9YB28_9ACTN|nr:acyl-CoA thioesterase [Iamia majanohamensis]WCO67828.1 acyl-CoA thioesterase [Iamia majanohamensis]